jgi:uncharacterized protein YndB with AHSA1/START domain
MPREDLDADRPLQAELEIAAPVTEVWRVVSDLRRTPEWSPECRKVIPVGTVRAGTWLIGLNRRGSVRWPTLSRVTSWLPPAEVSWKVGTNGSVWTYRLRPTPTGTMLTETRTTPDGVGWVARAFTRLFLGGQCGHDDELESGMSSSLRQIQLLVESPR